MIAIRSAHPGDGAGIAAIYGPFVRDTWVSFEEGEPDAREMAGRIEAARDTFPWLVATNRRSDGGVETIAGFAYASEHRARAGYRWSVDVSVYLDAPYRRSGIARNLYGTLFALLEAQRYTMVYAGIALPNDASLGFHARMGFTPVGTYHNVGYKAGDWHDVIWLERPLAERRSPPPELRALRDLSADERRAIFARASRIA
jgi:phosphinothricin acetyltransferase